jgi:hypothetical protein
LPLAAAFKRVSSPFRSFPVFACGLSAGVHWKSPYRFKWVGGSAAHCVYAKNKNKALPYRFKKRFLVLFGVPAKKNTLLLLCRYENRSYRGKCFIPRNKYYILPSSAKL